jgi:hypothetical protein
MEEMRTVLRFPVSGWTRQRAKILEGILAGRKSRNRHGTCCRGRLRKRRLTGSLRLHRSSNPSFVPQSVREQQAASFGKEQPANRL